MHLTAITKSFAAAMTAVLPILFAAGCRTATHTETDYRKYFAPTASVGAVFHRPARQEYTFCGRSEINTRYTPCSTFKIVSTLMALETGAASGRHTRLGYDGTRYEYAAWNRDVTLEEAFRASCVWYYKKLVARLPRDDVRRTLERLHYGNGDISAWNNNGHNVFWIESTLRISPLEQVRVLEKIFGGRSGFKPEYVALVREFMFLGKIGSVGFYGKTGTGRNYNTNRLEGWLAGLLELPDGETVYYAVHVADPGRDISGPDVRRAVAELVRQVFAANRST